MTLLSFFLPPASDPPPEKEIKELFQGVKRSLDPAKESKEAVWNSIQKCMHAPHPLAEVRRALQPSASLHGRVWQHVLNRIDPFASASFWDRIRCSLQPQQDSRSFLQRRMQLRFSVVPTFSRFQRPLSWVAAFVLVLFAIRVSPFLFIASRGNAVSTALLVPSHGEVSVLIGGLWQPVQGEVELKKGALIQTGAEGNATVIMHDDGVLRLDTSTTVNFRDVTDHNARSYLPSSFVLRGGKLWVQALIPGAVGQDWRIVTKQGDVIVNEGSISLEEKQDGRVEIAVWDRAARVINGQKEIILVAGEKLSLLKGGSLIARKATDLEENDEWVAGNLKKDAVHRREIALRQQERRIQRAGILPTSTLYPVKRVAEAVDIMLTFNKEAKVQKRLDQATTRLSEAEALLKQGSGADASVQLQEFKETLLAVATGSGQETSVRYLVQQQLNEEAAEVAAALPDDESYLIKKTVLETTAALPDSTMTPTDVQATVLADTLSVLTRRAEEGDARGAKQIFMTLTPSLSLIEDESTSLSPEVRREARAALMAFAEAVQEQEDLTGSGILTDGALSQYLPRKVPLIRSLTEAEIDEITQKIHNRIFTYSLPRSRYNQLLAEFHALESHPDRGRILRHLYHILPENGLARYVRTEFQRAREQSGLPE